VAQLRRRQQVLQHRAGQVPDGKIRSGAVLAHFSNGAVLLFSGRRK
jgi:hypothetical protein